MYYLEDKIILLGPYVGEFKDEILSFIPFVNWFTQNFTYKDIFVSTHYDSSFLYKEKNIPIMRHYTNDKKSQYKHLHTKINAKDYKVLKKIIIDNIVDISDYTRKDIISYDLGYSSTPNKTLYQNKFERLMIEPEYSDDVIFVEYGNSNRKRKEQKRIRNFLELEDNSFLSKEEMTRKVMGSRCVITPCCHWTAICNIHNIPVFSWCNNVSIYRNLYNFNNKYSEIIYTDRKLDKHFWSLLENFVKKHKES